MTRIALVCALALMLSGCGDKEKLKDIGNKATATWKAVASYTVAQKDKALTFFGERFSDLGDQWANAKEKSAGWSAETRSVLESKWAVVQRKYAETKDATGEHWAKARDAFVAAYDAFKAELAKER